MKKRFKMNKTKSKRNFTRNSGVHPKNNINTNPMRGGIRL